MSNPTTKILSDLRQLVNAEHMDLVRELQTEIEGAIEKANEEFKSRELSILKKLKRAGMLSSQTHELGEIAIKNAVERMP